MAKPNAQLLQQAKAAEQRGEVDEAARLYLSVGDIDEASRVYMGAGQFAKAGRALFRAVGLPLDRMQEATHDQRKLAVRAAICLAKGGETHNAAALFVAAGDKRRALETLERAGDSVGAARLRAQMESGSDPRVAHVSGQVAAAKFANGLKLEQAGDLAGALSAYIQSKAFADAARLARKLGKVNDAGQLFEEAGMYYEAAVCWNDVKDLRRCYDAITRVPREHPRYRGSALKAVELAAHFGEVSFEMDQFVSKFLTSGPESTQELEAFTVLGKLYENSGFQDNARECYRKVVAAAPQHRAAKMLLELESAVKASAMVYEKIVREDGSFRGDLPRQRMGTPQANSFPDLPDLPSLPPPPPLTQPMASPATARTEYGVKGPPQQPGQPPPGAMPYGPPGAYPPPGYGPPGYGYPPGYGPPPGYPAPGTGSFGALPGTGSYQAAPQGYGPPQYPPQGPGGQPGHAPTMAATAPYNPAQGMPPIPQGQPVTPQTHVQQKDGAGGDRPQQDTSRGHQTGSSARQDQGPLELMPGVLIADRYRLEKQIGQGGTAVVFRATDLELEEEVAIKVFTVVVDDPDMIRRFKQELTVTRALSHPNIVRLHDIGTHRGFRFLSMEILQGTDLASVLQEGFLPLAKSLDYLVQACNGLQLAHERGIVHRDIKPENFFVTNQDVLKIMDFGIAKKSASSKMTQTGFIAGTPPYMSPEQISGFASVSHLADIYSLGIVAYEMFTGSLPFMHDEMMPLLLMHMNDAPEAPMKRNPKIPQALNDLIVRLLEKQPSARVQSMKELADELTRIRPLLVSAG